MTTSRVILDPQTLPAAGRPWTMATLVLLAVLLVFMPAAFGAVEAWSELVVMLGAAALSICLALRAAFDPEFRPARTWLYLPLAAFALLAAFQLLSLPIGLAGWLSPATVSTKQSLLTITGEPAARTTLSFYPLATAQHLRLLLVGIVVFAVVASSFRTAGQIKTLLAVIFAIGCAEATVALLQLISGARQIYWSVDTASGGLVTSGTFINYSNFCQFMNLSLGAGIALLLVRLQEDHRHESPGSQGRFSGGGSWETQGWLIAGIVVSVIAVLTSMSRNGALSLIVASGIVGTALYWRGSLSARGWLLAIVPLGVLAVLLVTRFDVVYERLATLQHSEEYAGRVEMTTATLRAWREFPLWGAGLGAHEFVFPMFDEALTRSVAAHADNDYAQLLEEMGLAGAVAVGTFLAMIALLAGRLMFRGRSSLSAAAYGLTFGLVAVAIHSGSDFGQRVPAVFCLSAAACGLLVAIDRHEQQSRRGRAAASGESAPPLRGLARAASVLLLIPLVGVWGWAIPDAYAAYLAERWWSAAVGFERALASEENATRDPREIDQYYVDLIAASENAFRAEPGNVKYGHWLSAYRWQALSNTVDPDTGEVLLHPDVVPFIERIADDLSGIRPLAPSYGPPMALEGELRFFVLADDRGAKLIDEAVRLSPYDAATTLVAGQLAARRGEIDKAQELLERAVGLNGSYFGEAAALYLFELRRPDLARALAGNEYRRLMALARLAAAEPAYQSLAAELEAEAQAALGRLVSAGDASPTDVALLAGIALAADDHGRAIELYRQALSQDYRRNDWRLALARALAASGQVDEAIREVRICLRLRPEQAAAKALLEELVEQAESIRP